MSQIGVDLEHRELFERLTLESASDLGCSRQAPIASDARFARKALRSHFKISAILGIYVPERFRFRMVPHQHGLIFNTEQYESRVTIRWFIEEVYEILLIFYLDVALVIRMHKFYHLNYFITLYPLTKYFLI